MPAKVEKQPMVSEILAKIHSSKKGHGAYYCPSCTLRLYPHDVNHDTDSESDDFVDSS